MPFNNLLKDIAHRYVQTTGAREYKHKVMPYEYVGAFLSNSFDGLSATQTSMDNQHIPTSTDVTLTRSF